MYQNIWRDRHILKSIVMELKESPQKQTDE